MKRGKISQAGPTEPRRVPLFATHDYVICTVDRMDSRSLTGVSTTYAVVNKKTDVEELYYETLPVALQAIVQIQEHVDEFAGKFYLATHRVN